MADDEKRLLGLRAIKVFPELFEDAWKHDGPSLSSQSCYCSKCGELMESCKKPTVSSTAPCTVADPMPITWDNAHKLVGECNLLKVGFALEDMWKKDLCENHINLKFPAWLIAIATPADYIEAACIAKEQTEGGESK